MNNKLIKIQNELNVPKAQRNNFGNYNYRSCEDILEALKPLLTKYELLLTLNDEVVSIGDRFYIKATVRLEDGEKFIEKYGFAREEETKKGMDGSQITGASSSYARKYALNGMFLIDDSRDSDATNDGKGHTPVKPSAPTQPETDDPSIPPMSQKQYGLLQGLYKAKHGTEMPLDIEETIKKLNIKRASDLITKWKSEPALPERDLNEEDNDTPR